MGIVITVVILVVGGFFIYTKYVKPAMSGKYGEAYVEAQKEFDENRDKLLNEYFDDRNRFGMFKEAIGGDEKIEGIVSCVVPKSVGKSIGEGIKTGITGIKKVDMDLYFLVVTDKNLHHIDFNGENSVDHLVLSLGDIKNMTIAKASSLNLKDQITGIQGNIDKMKFEYKDKEFSFNLYRSIVGYPRFEAVKDSNGQYGHSYFYDPTGGAGYSPKGMMTREFMIDGMVKDFLYQAFKSNIEANFHIKFPA